MQREKEAPTLRRGILPRHQCLPGDGSWARSVMLVLTQMTLVQDSHHSGPRIAEPRNLCLVGIGGAGSVPSGGTVEPRPPIARQSATKNRRILIVGC